MRSNQRSRSIHPDTARVASASPVDPVCASGPEARLAKASADLSAESRRAPAPRRSSRSSLDDQSTRYLHVAVFNTQFVGEVGATVRSRDTGYGFRPSIQHLMRLLSATSNRYILPMLSIERMTPMRPMRDQTGSRTHPGQQYVSRPGRQDGLEVIEKVADDSRRLRRRGRARGVPPWRLRSVDVLVHPALGVANLRPFQPRAGSVPSPSVYRGFRFRLHLGRGERERPAHWGQPRRRRPTARPPAQRQRPRRCRRRIQRHGPPGDLDEDPLGGGALSCRSTRWLAPWCPARDSWLSSSPIAGLYRS